MNTNLTNCHSCKQSISRTLELCPKCGRDQRVMGKCEICSELFYGDDGGLVCYGRQAVWSGNQKRYLFHKKCLAPMKNQLQSEFSALNCPDCGCAFTIPKREAIPLFSRYACQNCGRQIPDFTEAEVLCAICGLPVFRTLQACLTNYGITAHKVCMNRLGLHQRIK